MQKARPNACKVNKSQVFPTAARGCAEVIQIRLKHGGTSEVSKRRNNDKKTDKTARNGTYIQEQSRMPFYTMVSDLSGLPKKVKTRHRANHM